MTERVTDISCVVYMIIVKIVQGFLFNICQFLFDILPYSERPDRANLLLMNWDSSEIKNLLLEFSRKLDFSDRKEVLNSLSSTGQLDFPDCPIHIYTNSKIELNARLKSCAKEPMTTQWLRSELKTGDVFYDIGANVGAYSLIASSFLKDRASVYAFEPNFLNFYQLCRNIILNNVQDIIVPLQVSLCQQTELNNLYYHNLEEGGALHSFSRAIDYKADEFVPQLSLGMIGFSLNDIGQIHGVRLPTLLKLDVDGLEYDILLGAQNILSSHDLRSILIEINEKLPEEAQNILDLLWYKGYFPQEKHQLIEGLYNYIFYRGETGNKAPMHFSEVTVASVRDSTWLTA